MLWRMRSAENPFEDLDSGHYLLRLINPRDKRLFVVFSHRGSRRGRFAFYKSFIDLNVNVLHVTAPQERDWFLNGMVDLGDHPDKAYPALAERVNKLCRDYRINKIIALGTSMGAYAALWFALRTELTVPVRVIGFSTEIKPRLPGSKSIEDEVPDRFVSFEHSDFSNADVQLIFGEFDAVDCYNALLLKGKPGVRHYSILAGDHLLPEHINSKLGFTRFLREFIRGVEYFGGRGRMAEALDAEDLAPMIFRKSFSAPYLAGVRRCVEKYPGFAYGWNRLGVCLEKRGQYEKAIDALKRSLLIVPDLPNSETHLTTSRMERDRKNQSNMQCQGSPSTAPGHGSNLDHRPPLGAIRSKTVS